MTEPAEDQTVRPFADWLREQSKGLTHEELSDALRDLTARVVDTGKKGSLTLTITIAPLKGDVGALVVADEITSEDGLSSTAAELLKALVEHPSEAAALTERLGALSGPEQSRIFERLLDLARPIDAWGVPDILEALLVMAQVAPSLSGSLAGFLGGRPAVQIQPDLIPRISGQPWASDLMTTWASSHDIEAPVKAAIASRMGNGNIAK